jgi:hypothetical protein
MAAQLQHNYPQYNGVSSTHKPDSGSMYNGFTFRADKATSQGLSFTFSLTKGLEYDNQAAGVNGWQGAVVSTYANQYNPKAEWAKGAQNLDYAIVGSFIYELPFGHGKQLLNSGLGFGDKFVKGWQISGIENWSTGTPIVIGGANNGTTQQTYGGLAQRPEWNGISPKLTRPSYNLWFNPNVYSMPLSYQIGNAPPVMSVNNPSYQNIDLLIAKNTYFGAGDKYRVQARLEMFNAFNHPVLGSPDSNVSDLGGTFGQIQGYSNNSRQIQLGAKFNF